MGEHVYDVPGEKIYGIDAIDAIDAIDDIKEIPLADAVNAHCQSVAALQKSVKSLLSRFESCEAQRQANYAAVFLFRAALKLQAALAREEYKP